MPPRKGGPSTEPLTEEEETQVEAWIKDRLSNFSDHPDEDLFLARVVALFYYLGIHPACLARKTRYSLRAGTKWISWNRTKHYQSIRFPMVPEIAGWAERFINDLEECHPISYNRAVHRAGRKMGIPSLTPRALRHTRAAVLMERTGFNTAKMLTGTTDEILVGYGKRAASKADLSRLLEQGFK